MSGENFSVLYEDKEDIDFERRCYPSTGDIKVFQYRDDPLAYEIRGGFKGITRLIQELGAPNHFNTTYCVRLSRTEEFVKAGSLPSNRFKNYTVERVGLKIEPLPSLKPGSKAKPFIKDSSLYVSQPSYWYERPDYLVQVWRTRVFAYPLERMQTSPSHPLSLDKPLGMYFEECWHPTRGKQRSIHWLAHWEGNHSKIEHFRRDALWIIEGQNKIGRPLGSKKYGNPQEFIRVYTKAYRIAAERRKGQPSQVLVVAEIENLSLRTFQERLKDHKLPWPLE